MNDILKIRINKFSPIPLSFYIITVSGSLYVTNAGLQIIFEYLGYGILLASIFIHYLKAPARRRKHLNGYAFILLILFSIGILLQELVWTTKFTLLLTMLAIIFTYLLSEGIISSYKEIKTISYAVFTGVITSTVLALISGISITGSASEGIFGSSFSINGGILYKNYFAADMLAVYMGLFICSKFGYKSKTTDRLIMFLSVLCIILSGSRGAFVLFVVFLIVIEYDKIKMIKGKQRTAFIFILVIVCIIVFAFLYRNIALNSSTYMYRIRGLLNYLDYSNGDLFHMVFGNAEMAYDQETSYVLTIRSIVGWDGSLEFAWLDILIKNGILGIVGFALIFIRSFKIALSTNNWKVKAILIAVTATCLCSSLVETYIQSIHAVFGIYCYMIMAACCNLYTNELHK
ncbi:MAG: hypothetical protein LUG88_04495 [Clostridia bacterium]|nr:hypothetical protein [Clostridia bacterium]